MENTKHYIQLANDYKISIGGYLTTLRYARNNPSQWFSQGFSSMFPVTGETILKEFREGLNDRINKNDVRLNFRKFKSDYQNDLIRDARKLKDIKNRIRVYQFSTDIFQKRFSHLLSNYNDL